MQSSQPFLILPDWDERLVKIDAETVPWIVTAFDRRAEKYAFSARRVDDARGGGPFLTMEKLHHLPDELGHLGGSEKLAQGPAPLQVVGFGSRGAG
jgi:hypothetical protein